MKKSLEQQYLDARQDTKKVFNEFYKESKYEMIIIWTLSLFALGFLIAALFL